MSEAICGLCAEAVAPEDYNRELDCSRKCESNIFHEPCIERYLRKHGNSPDQKTGFRCPATISTGKPCLGTIKKTHVRLPSNLKKKEHNRQAAIAVNIMVNSVRGGTTMAPVSKVKDAAVKPAAPNGITKVVKMSVVQHQPGQGVVVYSHNRGVPAATPSLRDTAETGTLNDDFTNLRQIGKRASRQLDGGESDSGSSLARLCRRPGERVFAVVKQTPAQRHNAPAKVAGGNGWAVSKNSAMAPEPVVRQRAIPGLTEPMRPRASGSNLEQQRALVAELRAREKVSMANRATSAAPTGVRKADAGAGPEAGKLEAAQAQEKVRTELAAATESPAGAQLQEQQPPVQPSLRRSSSYGQGASATEGQTPALVSSLFPDTTLPAFPAAGDTLELAYGVVDDESDPIVLYDQLFSLEDGTLVVMDSQHSGGFVRVKDLYGEGPEMLSFQDEAGNVTTYIAVRSSAVAATQQRLADRNLAVSGVDAMQAFRAAEASLHDAASMLELKTQTGVLQAAAVEADEQDDIDELLSLCLG